MADSVLDLTRIIQVDTVAHQRGTAGLDSEVRFSLTFSHDALGMGTWGFSPDSVCVVCLLDRTGTIMNLLMMILTLTLTYHTVFQRIYFP